jgi:nucleoid-associated protein YgaU
MGLVAGSILAGVALLWVATRPGLAPRPQPVPSSAGKEHDLPRAGSPVTAPDASPALQADRARFGERKTQEPPASQSGFRPPPSVVRDLSSAAPNLPGRPKTEPAQTSRFHTVRPGETLSSIAQQYYGSANEWRKILTANEKTIKDANKIAPGTQLIIPD